MRINKNKVVLVFQAAIKLQKLNVNCIKLTEELRLICQPAKWVLWPIFLRATLPIWSFSTFRLPPEVDSWSAPPVFAASDEKASESLKDEEMWPAETF